MAADRPHARHTGLDQRLAEIGGRADPVAQVVVLDDLLQALRHRLQVAACQPAVGREALGEDEHGAAPLGPLVGVHGQPAADVGQGVLLAAHRHSVSQGGHLADDVGNGGIGVTILALLDEPGILGEAAGVQEQRQAVSVADLAHGSEVGQRHRLSATGVVRDRDEHHRDVVDAALPDQGLQRIGVHVALEGMDRRGRSSLRDHQVDRLCTAELDVGAGGVEVRVRRDDLARTADDAEQDLLRRPALVGGDDVAEWPQLGHRLEEAVPRGRACVRLVAALDARPLLGRHRAGPRVGEQVDEHVGGVEVKQVVAGRLQVRLALVDGGHPDRLDALDPERLDDRAPALHAPPMVPGRPDLAQRRDPGA
jgi:hypothetical protein